MKTDLVNYGSAWVTQEYSVTPRWTPEIFDITEGSNINKNSNLIFCKNNGEILVSLTLIWFNSVFDTFWLVKMFYKEKKYTCTAPVLKGEIITMDEDETLLTWFRKHSFLHYIQDFENMYLESLYTVVSFTFSLKG